jgi:hypothetical protein
MKALLESCLSSLVNQHQAEEALNYPRKDSRAWQPKRGIESFLLDV